MSSVARRYMDRRSLGILALAVLAICLFAAGCVGSYLKLREERHASAQSDARRLLLAFDAHSTRLFDYADGYLRATRAYAQAYGTGERLENFVHAIEAPHAESFTGVVYIVDRDGWLVYQSETPQDKLKALGRMSDLDHFQYFLKHPGDSLFVGPTRTGRVTGKRQFRLARPLLKNGVFDGVVVITLRPEHITDFYRDASLGPHSTVTVTTLQANLIARHPQPPAGIYDRELPDLKALAVDTQGEEDGRAVNIQDPLDHLRRDVFYKTLQNYPVSLSIGIAEQDVDDALAGVRRNLIMLALTFSAIALLVCALVMRLTRQNRRLASTEAASRSAARQLQASEARLHSIFDASPDALLISDGDGRIVMANRQVEQLLGYTVGELLDQSIDVLVPPRLRAVHSVLRHGFVASTISHIPGQGRELKALCRDGRECDVEISLSRIPTNEGLFIATALRDITERKAAAAELEAHRQNLESLVSSRTHELAQARDAAEQANRAKSAFLATMSHEIRTPLNAVVGLTGLLADAPLDRRQRDYADKILASAKALRALIDDILDFSKIEAGALRLEQAPFSLSAILRTTAAILSVAQRGKPIEALFDVQWDFPDTLLGDSLRLQQILLNLTSNAVKFTEAGEIVVSMRCLEEEAGHVTLQFVVRDTGIGIPPEQLERIFEVFAQADASTCRQYGGSGLGLAISNRLAGLMGGRIDVASTSGVGSEFSFTVPLRLTDGPPPVAATGELAGLRILIVDDHPLARDILAQGCAAFDWQATTLESGAACLEELQNAAREGREYDLMLLDWRMPDLDGIETLRLAHGLPEVGLPLVILMASAYELEQAAAASDDLYLDGLLAKPVTPASLFEAVSRAWSGEGFAPPPGSTDHRLAGMRLLVAEDNELNQQVIEQILSRAGAEVVIAANGLAAVEVLRGGDKAFDAVLMDIQMPVMDGYTATRVIREELGFRTLPIIAVTAHALPEDRERARRAGMAGHVAKPIDVEDLLDILSRDHKAAVMRPPMAPGAAVIELPGLDVAAGLRAFGGDSRSYAALLQQFSEGHGGDVATARRLFITGDSGGAARLVHDLLGMSRFLRATDVASLAAATERKLLDGETETLLPLFEELQVAMFRLGQSLVRLNETEMTA